LNKILRKKFSRATDTPEEVFPETEEKQSLADQVEVDQQDISSQEAQLMRMLLSYGSEPYSEEFGTVAQFIVHDLQSNDVHFENAIFNEIVLEYMQALKEEKSLSENYFTGHSVPRIAKMAIELIATQHYLSDNWKKNKIYVKTESEQLYAVVTTTMLSFKAKFVSKKLKEVLDQLKFPGNENNSDLLDEYIFLKSVSQEINKELSRVISY